MQTLASEIAEKLKTAKHCAVYEPELTRVWPGENDKIKRAKIEAFARSHGWRLRFYRDGLCAIFDKE
jgi:hypothetical protein